MTKITDHHLLVVAKLRPRLLDIVGEMQKIERALHQLLILKDPPVVKAGLHDLYEHFTNIGDAALKRPRLSIER